MAGLKIIVAYDKSSDDFRDLLAQYDPEHEVYVPVMGGHALGEVPSVFFFLLGDDTGENISTLNPYICEMSHIYWAWKHLEELGNPDHIGLCHYRRIIIPYAWYYSGLGPDEIMIHMGQYPSINFYRMKGNIPPYIPPLQNEAFEIINTLFPNTEDQAFLSDWKYRHMSPSLNVFIADIEEFNRFMEFVTRELELLNPVIEGSKTGAYQQRAAAYILEFVNGFYFDHAFNVRGKRCIQTGAGLRILS